MDGNLFGSVTTAFYDLDGTLLDSVWVWREIDDEYLARFGLIATPEFKRELAGRGNREGAAFTAEYFGLSIPVDEIIKEWYAMAAVKYSREVKLVPHVREYILEKKARGIKQYVLTGLSADLAKPCLEHNGIIGEFDGIITTDGAGYGKMRPELYLCASRAANADPERCVMFDDVFPSLEAARKVGFKTVAVRSEYGYDDGCDSGEVDLVIKSFAEMLRD